MVKYQSSFEKLVRPVQKIAEVKPKPSKLLGIIDLRGQIGGKALIYETAVTEGVLYLEVPQATFALSVISFVRYLKGKGITPVLLLGETQDLGILRLVDMFCTANPRWGTVREGRDGMQCASTVDHPLERPCEEWHVGLQGDVG